MHTSLTGAQRVVTVQSEARFEIIDDFVDIGKDGNKGTFFRMKWDGQLDELHWAWNYTATVKKDVLDLGRDFYSDVRTSASPQTYNVTILSSDSLTCLNSLIPHEAV